MPIFLDITIRAILTYITLLFFSRLMGKREISQMTFFDYVTGITIGSIGAHLCTNINSKWIQELPAAIVFCFLPIISSILSKKRPVTPFDLNLQLPNQELPRLLIEEGKLLNENIKDMRLTRSWVMTKLAEQGVYDISKVMLAQVDTLGNLYVDLYDNLDIR